MTDIIFRFDTEDYVNEVAAEGILRSAELLRKNGIRGSFVTVGMLAEALEKWGRFDVIEALRHHEIGLHSYSHSMHPNICEYTDIENFDDALAEFLKQEKNGRDIIRRITGNTEFKVACPPGYCTSYVAQYGYADMGMTIYSGNYVGDEKASRPVHSCNIASVISAIPPYPFFEIYKTEKERLEYLDNIAETKEICVVAHHPQRPFVTTMTDIDNFSDSNTPKENWKLSPRRTKEETEKFYKDFEWLIKTLKNDSRFNIVTHGDISKKYCEYDRVITINQVPELKKQLNEKFFPVTVPDSYCISDILLACKDFLEGKNEHKCGKVYGFLSKPYAIEEPITVTATEIKKSASQICDGFLPLSITVGNKRIGPADWLRAAMEVLSGVDSVTINPDVWQIDLDQFPKLKTLKYDKNVWPCFSHTLKDNYLSDRLRLQTWTIRLPKNTSRLIFE